MVKNTKPPASGHKKVRISPKAKLTPAQVREIRKKYAAGTASQPKLAQQFSVSQATIHMVVKNKVYRSVV